VFGSSEMQPLASEEAFDTQVKIYLEETQRRCPGEFAIVPNDSKQQGATRIDSYEVACVGNNVSSSVSLLFFNKNDTFVVMAHEAPAEKMDDAMNIRDRLLQTISGS
jgi:hypothetical protein